MQKVVKLPDELLNVLLDIQKCAEKQGFKITMAEAMRIIAKSYKSK